MRPVSIALVLSLSCILMGCTTSIERRLETPSASTLLNRLAGSIDHVDPIFQHFGGEIVWRLNTAPQSAGVEGLCVVRLYTVTENALRPNDLILSNLDRRWFFLGEPAAHDPDAAGGWGPDDERWKDQASLCRQLTRKGEDDRSAHRGVDFGLLLNEDGSDYELEMAAWGVTLLHRAVQRAKSGEALTASITCVECRDPRRSLAALGLHGIHWVRVSGQKEDPKIEIWFGDELESDFSGFSVTLSPRATPLQIKIGEFVEVVQ